MLKRMSLQSKILLMFSIVIIITMLAGIIFNSYTFYDAMKKTYVSQLKGITTTINGGYEESHSAGNVQQIFDYLKHREENILRLNLHVRRGDNPKIIASTDRSLIGVPSPDVLLPTLDLGKTMVSHLGDEDKHIVRMVAPLLEDGVTIGAIELYLDNSVEVALIQQRIILITAFGITISIILLILLWFIIRRLLVLPLFTLREAAMSFKKGKRYEPVQLNASYELNEVAIAFNEMVYDLEDRYLKSITDSLTGLYNSAFFKQKLAECLNQAINSGKSMALLFCDIDNFKKLNDREGHIYGDKILKQTAQIIKGNVRPSDIVCRYGGEEFVVIMPDTDEHSAEAQAEKIRHLIGSYANKSDLHPITISIGIAIFPHDSDEENIIHMADKAMYTAKSLGKNRVVKASDISF